MIGEAAEQELYYNGTSETSIDGVGIINNTQSSISDLQICTSWKRNLPSIFVGD